MHGADHEAAHRSGIRQAAGGTHPFAGARPARISLNRAALLLLRRGAGLEEGARERDVVGDSLDRFIGDGTDAEARSFEKAVSVFETVDEDAWN